MAREDKRRKRILVRVQLGNDAQSQHIGDIMAYWRSLRLASYHLRRAIAMYYALLSGDSSLLIEYFPKLVFSGLGAPLKSQPVEAIPDFDAGAVRDVQHSDGDDFDDFLGSLGLE